MKPVSVLTIVKGRGEHLRQLIAGLRRSTVAPAELVVVDMSTPPLDMPVVGFPVTVLRLSETGLPLARARNMAARNARTDRLIFLDVDCIPAADLIARLGEALDRTDGLICADVRYLPPADAGKNWSEAELQAAGIAHPARTFPAEGLRLETNVGLFWSLAFGLRKSTFDRLGGFDQRFHGYGGEDPDFGFRAEAAGIPLLFLGGAGAFHQHHDVYEPPLQHFDDIVRNAGLFHRIWGVLPMEGWLARFHELGLITLQGDRIERLRPPSACELANARKSDGAPF